MLILNRKLDLRMWVVINSWNPLKIYIYKECYVRFSCNDYDPRCPENLFSHLTNNSVAKKLIERPDNAKSIVTEELTFFTEAKPAELTARSHCTIAINQNSIISRRHVDYLESHGLISIESRS